MDKPINRRNYEIDFVKGILVVGMVLYHSLDYFQFGSSMIKYVQFITGSFIFTSGFLVSAIHMKKYDVQTSGISRRLYMRGFKLLVLFILLNAVLYFLGWQTNWKNGVEVESISDAIYIIFVSGTYKMVAFDILVPIAYSLFLAGGLICVFRERTWLYMVLAAVAILYCSLMFYGNQEAYNLRYMTIGICGFALGFIDSEKLLSLSQYSLWIFGFFLIYLIGLHKINMFYPQYVVITIFNILVIYIAGVRISSSNLIVRTIYLLGEYSLLSYLTQIAILQVLVRSFLAYTYNPSIVFLIFIITNALMVLCVALVSRFRTGSKTVDRLYRIVFA